MPRAHSQPSLDWGPELHVLYLHQHFSQLSGATGTRSWQMAQRLIARGHSVTLLCGSGVRCQTGLTGAFQHGIRRGILDGIQIIECQLPYSNYDSLLKRTATFLRFAFRATQFALTSPYDLILASSTPLTVAIPAILAKTLRRNKTFVFEVRDLWPELPRAMGVIRNPLLLAALSLLETLAYRSADACIALSPGILEGIRSKKFPAARLAMIPNGADLELFQPVARKDAATQARQPFRAVYAGAHGRANGLDALLDVAVQLKSRKRRDIQLVLIGDGLLKPRLQQRAQRQQLDNCIFLEYIPKNQFAQILPTFDLGLMTLADVSAFRMGTSPNKFFDYLAAGLPVLFNYPGWLSDYLQTATFGIQVPPGDPQAFADALEQLADDPQGCRQMGHAARQLAEKSFARELLSARWVEFVEAASQKKL